MNTHKTKCNLHFIWSTCSIITCNWSIICEREKGKGVWREGEKNEVRKSYNGGREGRGGVLVSKGRGRIEVGCREYQKWVKSVKKEKEERGKGEGDRRKERKGLRNGGKGKEWEEEKGVVES